MAEWTDDRTQTFAKLIFGNDGVEFGRTWSKGLVVYRRTRWIEQDKEWDIEPTDLFTLENLFKWAVPKVREVFIERYKYTRYGKEHIESGVAQFMFFLRGWIDKLIDPDIDPALALAEATENILKR